MLIDLNNKFYPVKKYAVDLDDMSEGNKLKYLSADRRWYLKIEGLYRDNVDMESQKNDFDILNQDFCLIITIRDSKDNSNVYDGTVQKLEEYNFIHNPININTNINIHN
jgi:hypothetical protein